MYTLILSLLLITTQSFAEGGRDVGNGGDGYATEFASIARNIVDHWGELKFPESFQITRETFESAMKRARIHSVTTALEVKGYEVDAKNYPFCEGEQTIDTDEKKCGVILLNRARWDALRSDRVKKVALVFHEYLGVLGMNEQRFDDFYEVTAPIFESMRELMRTQKIIEVSFSCWVEAWDRKKNRIEVIERIDTYDLASPRALVEIKRGRTVTRHWLEIREIEGDYFARTTIDRLHYTLSAFRAGDLPNRDDVIASDFFDFKDTGKRTLRIWNDPEIQLTCFRTFDRFMN